MSPDLTRPPFSTVRIGKKLESERACVAFSWIAPEITAEEATRHRRADASSLRENDLIYVEFEGGTW